MLFRHMRVCVFLCHYTQLVLQVLHLFLYSLNFTVFTLASFSGETTIGGLPKGVVSNHTVVSPATLDHSSSIWVLKSWTSQYVWKVKVLRSLRDSISSCNSLYIFLRGSFRGICFNSMGYPQGRPLLNSQLSTLVFLL